MFNVFNRKDNLLKQISNLKYITYNDILVLNRKFGIPIEVLLNLIYTSKSRITAPKDLDILDYSNVIMSLKKNNSIIFLTDNIDNIVELINKKERTSTKSKLEIKGILLKNFNTYEIDTHKLIKDNNISLKIIDRTKDIEKYNLDMLKIQSKNKIEPKKLKVKKQSKKLQISSSIKELSSPIIFNGHATRVSIPYNSYSFFKDDNVTNDTGMIDDSTNEIEAPTNNTIEIEDSLLTFEMQKMKYEKDEEEKKEKDSEKIIAFEKESNNEKKIRNYVKSRGELRSGELSK